MNETADEWGLYRYVTKSFKAFEQDSFAKALEKDATVSGLSVDVEPGEDGNGRDTGFAHPDGSLVEAVAGAMVAGLEENILEFDILEEAVER